MRFPLYAGQEKRATKVQCRRCAGANEVHFICDYSRNVMKPPYEWAHRRVHHITLIMWPNRSYARYKCSAIVDSRTKTSIASERYWNGMAFHQKLWPSWSPTRSPNAQLFRLHRLHWLAHQSNRAMSFWRMTTRKSLRTTASLRWERNRPTLASHTFHNYLSPLPNRFGIFFRTSRQRQGRLAS